MTTEEPNQMRRKEGKVLEALIIDDQPPIGPLSKDFQNKIEFDMAFDGDQGIERAGQKSYDVIILDYNMGELNGYQTGKKIRESQPNVRMIGFSDDWFRKEAEEIGLDFYSGDYDQIRKYLEELL